MDKSFIALFLRVCSLGFACLFLDQSILLAGSVFQLHTSFVTFRRSILTSTLRYKSDASRDTQSGIQFTMVRSDTQIAHSDLQLSFCSSLMHKGYVLSWINVIH